VSKWRRQLGKDAAKNIQINAWWYAVSEGLRQTIEAFKARNVSLPDGLMKSVQLRKPTRYSLDAEQLDETRSSAYWKTTVEMFARAGAAYVQDKISAAGGRNDYLVFGADDNRQVDGVVGSPNPSGEDRIVLQGCFDALISEYKNSLNSP
jgi:hypothetical protein